MEMDGFSDANGNHVNAKSIQTWMLGPSIADWLTVCHAKSSTGHKSIISLL